MNQIDYVIKSALEAKQKKLDLVINQNGYELKVPYKSLDKFIKEVELIKNSQEK